MERNTTRKSIFYVRNMTEEIKKDYEYLDLKYDEKEYSDSKYLWYYNAESGWHGIDEIKSIEQKYENSKEILFDKEFAVFWEFYKNNLVQFDVKANNYKEGYKRMQKFSVFFTLLLPQIISFFALIDWEAYNISTLIPLLIPIPLSFIAAFLLSLLSLKKYENLFMNYRTSCEKLKRAAFDFQFNPDVPEERREKFIEDVLELIKQQLSEYEGIFLK